MPVVLFFMLCARYNYFHHVGYSLPEILFLFCLYKLKYRYFQFNGRHFGFPRPVSSRLVVQHYHYPYLIVEPRKIGTAVGISLLSCVQAAINVIEVLRPPSWIFNFRFLPVWSYNIAIILI